MKKAIVVIGANYGDEAKGAYTDFFASQADDSIVIRFNGGAQAGHTVQLGLDRIIFSHFGSGSLAGRPTYLSEFFVNHPMLFIQEWDNLASKFITPKVYVHPNGLVTTPWDMMLNQLKELKRKKTGEHHGSVGVGFGETVERQSTEYALTVKDLKSPYLLGKLRAIKNIYFIEQIKKFELEREYSFFKETMESPFIEDNFIHNINFFLAKIIIWDYTVINEYKISIFEGAQGLLLDMDKGNFPHVTRSNTGLQNAISILKHLELNQLGMTEVDVYYLSRVYLSKHGAGPLPDEVEELIGVEVIDETNKKHDYQGSLRFAPLNHQELLDRTDIDFLLSKELKNIKFNKHICFSCVDQIKDASVFSYETSKTVLPIKAYISYLKKHSSYCSYGPTRNDIRRNN